MAAVPVILNGVVMPKGKSADDEPIPCIITGYISIAGLEVGGGPIIPDGTPPVDPPIDPPVDPPPAESSPGVAVVIKPAPVTGGWGLATQGDKSLTWFFVPGQGGPGPKR